MNTFQARATRPRLAVILTQYGATSHGICYCTKFLEGKQFDDHYEPPLCEVVSMHLMEIASNDIGLATAKKHRVPLYPSVATALCCGGDTLAVDGVVLIGEHGTYPLNEKGQQLYPRRELFDQIVSVFRQSGRVVPIFNDKHLSWNWAWAKYMWQTINALKIPWMAGSSLPFAKFEPFVPLPHNAHLDHVIAVGYGGLESYGFHSIETGQNIVEKRRGGETGVKSVQVLSGAAVWEAHNQGRWPKDIADAALASLKKPNGRPQDFTQDVFAYDIEYRDGQRMTVLMPNGYSQEFAFGYREKGKKEIIAASYFLDEVPRLKHFSATVRALEEMYLTGKPTAPSARTTLTTGILAYGIDSHFQKGVKLETPDLNISYKPMPTPAHWKEVLR
ncbi:hypothetical protein [Armatimonas sp.]|uniref:hypothetical protein n=1 Tax=Armatimonas sp. TaxID=1872638 RepID=UPI00286A6C55|nr:hypothetical protein [Armatimonas sp.]